MTNLLEAGWPRIRPTREEELCSELRSAHEDSVALYPLGGGTHLGSLGPPRTPGRLLDTTSLAGILAHDPIDLTLTARAGTTLASLREHLDAQGQYAALDAEDPERATLGGILAAGLPARDRTCGQAAREQVIGLRVAHAGGEISRCGGQVVKNTTGYDLAKLYCGSRGTLAVLLEISLRLHVTPPSCGLAAAPFADFERAHEAALALRDTAPATLDILAAEPAGALLAESFAGGSQILIATYRGALERVEHRLVDFRSAARDASSPLFIASAEKANALFARLLRPRHTLGAEPAGACLAVRARPSQAPDLRAGIERAMVRIAPAAGAILWSEGAGEIQRLLFTSAPAPDSFAALLGELRTMTLDPLPAFDLELAPPELHEIAFNALPVPRTLALMQRAKSVFDPHGVLFPGAFPCLEAKRR